MNLFLLELLRYVFLILIYIFLYRVTVTIMKDISSSEYNREAGWLSVIKSNYKDLSEGEKIRLTTPFQIGKKNNNDLIINNEYVSHNHVIIYSRNKEIWIEDLGSTNGTLLNESPLKIPVILKDMDIIDIGGSVVFKFLKS
jgi:hypothetical protein